MMVTRSITGFVGRGTEQTFAANAEQELCEFVYNPTDLVKRHGFNSFKPPIKQFYDEVDFQKFPSAQIPFQSESAPIYKKYAELTQKDWRDKFHIDRLMTTEYFLVIDYSCGDLFSDDIDQANEGYIFQSGQRTVQRYFSFDPLNGAGRLQIYSYLDCRNMVRISSSGIVKKMLS